MTKELRGCNELKPDVAQQNPPKAVEDKRMAKGASFEIEVFEAINKEILGGRLGLIPHSCKVFHNKGYHSLDRGCNIITDIAIEVYIAGSSEASIIWILECKDYKSPVPVSDIEEFHAKIQQFGADKTKGTVISRRPFQRDAIRYAVSKGIV